MALTGEKNIDYKILLQLTDNELAKVCRVNKKVQKLCDDEQFWRLKVYTLSTNYGEMNKARLFFPSWKEMYKYIVKNNIGMQETQSGFSKIVFLKDPLAEFLKVAYFGNQVLNSDDMSILRLFLDNGASSRAILTQLFILYFHTHQLSYIENGKKYFRVDDVINRYLDEYLTELEAKGNFDRNKSVFNKLNFFIKDNIISNDSLTPDQSELRNNAIIENTLLNISANLKNTLNKIRS